MTRMTRRLCENSDVELARRKVRLDFVDVKINCTGGDPAELCFSERGDAGLRYHIILRSRAADRTDCRRRELKSIEMTAGHIQVTEARGLRPNLTSASMLPQKMDFTSCPMP